MIVKLSKCSHLSININDWIFVVPPQKGVTTNHPPSWGLYPVTRYLQ